MPTLTTADYLKYANLQMAAEAFIRDEQTLVLASTPEAVISALIEGNKRSLKFTRPQAEAFVDAAKGWTVLDQRANTNTGFSGTLFRNNATGELVLSVAEAQSNGLGLRKTLSAGYGDKSRTAWDGEQKAATECEWRIAA